MSQESYEEKIDRRAVEAEETGPLTKWDNEPGLKSLQADLQMAQPGHDAHVTKVKKWLDLRNTEGSAKAKTKKGRSQVQPKLVRKQNEWRYSALSEPFLSSEKMFEISPRTWEDKESARQNELVINWQFRTKMNPTAFIDEFVRTTVDEGTSAIRVGWERVTKQVEVEVPVYDYVRPRDQQEAMQLKQVLHLMQRDPQGFSELPEEWQAAAEFTMDNQIPVIAIQNGVEMQTEEKVLENRPTVELIHYENLYIDPSCNGDLRKANFAVVSFETSQAELKKDGRYKNLNKVNWSAQTPLHVPEHAAQHDHGQEFEDTLRKRVVAYEYWGYSDIHGTGELVPIVATWVGRTLIRMEENPYPDQGIPIVLVPYLPVKNSTHGEPDAELLEENQAILGALTRGMIDLMGKSANGQTGHAKGMLDTLNRRRYERGEDYEYNPGHHPQTQIHQHTYPEIPQSALTMHQLQNQEAESLTGVKAFSGGLSGEAYGEVAAGIKGMLDASAKREMSILRRLAQGMEEVGRKILAMNAMFMSEEETVQITNDEFVEIRREDLEGEHNLKVDIATSEIDEAKAQDLGFMLQTLGNSMPFEMTQQILVDIARLKRMPDLAHRLENYKPEPNAVEQKKEELEVAKLEAEIEKIRTDAAYNRARARETLSDADLKDLNFVEQETGTQHMREQDLQQSQSAGNQELAVLNAILEQGKAQGEGQGPQKNPAIPQAEAYKQFSTALTSV